MQQCPYDYVLFLAMKKLPETMLGAVLQGLEWIDWQSLVLQLLLQILLLFPPSGGWSDLLLRRQGS